MGRGSKFGHRIWAQVLDIGQLAIVPEHRGGARFVMLCLLAAAQRHSQRVGRSYWVGSTSPGLIGAFRDLNPSVRVLDLDPQADRSEELSRYWAAYRGGEAKPLVAFILEPNGGAPTPVILRQFARGLGLGGEGRRAGAR